MYVSNPGHLRRKKQTRPLTWIRTFPWEAAFTSSSSFCPGSFSNHDCGGITSASWDYTSRGASTAPSPAPNTPTGRRTLKSEKGRPLLSFVSGEMQDNQLLRGDQSIKLLLLLWSTLLSSYKFPQILLTQVCGLHWLAPLRPLQSRTCCLSADRCWASALTNGPGAASLSRPPLRIPWSTSSTPHCCSHRAKRELCGRAPGRSCPNAGHVTLMGNRWKPLGQWFRFFLNHFSELNPTRSGPHSKLWICRSEVGPWNESSASSLFVLMLLPQDPHSGALSFSPHAQHSWDLSEGEGLGWEFLRDVRLEPGRESCNTWGSGLSKWPWVKCCGFPRLSVDGSIQMEVHSSCGGAGFWWALRVSLKRGL